MTAHLYVHRGADAARHLFRVAAGLDSLVVGEPQILGQVKAAYAIASDRQFTAALTNRLFHSAFTVGKRVRAETGLGEGAVSVSYAAIALAKKIFGDLNGRSVLVLGAGEMAKLTGIHLHAQHVKQITIASRTLAAAQGLAARLDGIAVPWDGLDAPLTAADIVVTATGASEPVLTRARVEDVMRPRRNRPLFIIDIAVPRDVESAVGNLDQVFLYNIDDLRTIVQENLARRGAELARAEAIVDEEVAKYHAWTTSREIVPTVVALRQRFETIRRAELQRLEPKLAGLPPEARQRIDEVTRLIVEKLLLTPTEQLKSVSDEAMIVAYADALNRLFRLAQDKDKGDIASEQESEVSS
jgi:glutamyl-tRNA reductase